MGEVRCANSDTAPPTAAAGRGPIESGRVRSELRMVTKPADESARGAPRPSARGSVMWYASHVTAPPRYSARMVAPRFCKGQGCGNAGRGSSEHVVRAVAREVAAPRRAAPRRAALRGLRRGEAATRAKRSTASSTAGATSGRGRDARAHLRVLQALHHQHARALAHDEAVAGRVPGA